MGVYRVSATRAVREFSELLRRTGEGGQEVLIERHRKPVARLSPAAVSPVRWIDFLRQLGRSRSPDSGLFDELIRLRGLKPGPASAPPLPFQTGTVLLDTTLLLRIPQHRFRLDRMQRVATTSAAIAELSSLAGQAGDLIQLVRNAYVARVVAVIPVLSLNDLAALSVAPSYGSPGAVFHGLAVATARSLDWPLVE